MSSDVEASNRALQMALQLLRPTLSRVGEEEEVIEQDDVASTKSRPLEDYTMVRNSNRYAHEAFGSYAESGIRKWPREVKPTDYTPKESVHAMKRRILEAQRNELQAELDRVDSHLHARTTSKATSLASASTASTSWYLIHRSKQILAPSFRDSTWAGADFALPKPTTSLPKPGDFFRMLAQQD